MNTFTTLKVSIVGLFLFFLVHNSFSQDYNVTLPQQCNTGPAAGSSEVITFTNAPVSANSDATLVITYSGDLDGTGGNLEILDFIDENGNNLGQTSSVTQCTGVGTFTTTIPLATLLPWLSDGQVDITAQANSNVAGTLCSGAGFCVTGQLSYGVTTADNDLGVASIDSPSVFCPGQYDVYATIQNYGTNTISSGTINWTLNGVGQTPFNFSGSLDTAGGSGNSSASILLGSVNFLANTPYNIVAWSSLPNGVADTVTANDTTSSIKQASLAGSLTIGGIGANYSDFTSAIADLNTFGVCGPVDFTINSGVYNEALTISEITGASSVNTIIFNGQDTSAVTLSHDGSIQNATIDLVGADWITFKNMRIEATANSLNAWAIHLMQEADHNTIDSCSIFLPINNTTNRVGIIATASSTSISAEGNNANFTTISNNVITGGSRSITFEGAGTGNWTVGNAIINNILQSADDYGFYGDDQDSLIFSGNTIRDLQDQVNADGFYSFDFENLIISENNIKAPDWGIYCSDLNVDQTGGRARIANNMVISDADYGIYILDGIDVDIFHNSIIGDPAIDLDYSIDGLDGIDVQNNIFVSNNDYAFEIDLDGAVPGVSTLNNNIYETKGTDFVFWEGTPYPDLPTWQAALPAYNANSLEGDPIFAAPDDLHAIGPLANNQGAAGTGITIDIDGDPRNATIPDIGADEFSLIVDDAGVVSIDSPTVFCPGQFDVYATIANFGINQITSASVNWSVDGVPQPVASFSGLLDTLGGTGSRFGQVFLGSFNFSTNNIYLIEAYTVNPNGVADVNNTNDTLLTTIQSNLPPPTGITTTALSATQATLTWTGGSANSWLWVNVPAGNPLTGTGTAVTSATAVVNGLSSETDYDFYVREVCASGDTSLWAGPFSYKTPFLCPPNSVCFLSAGQEGRDGPSQAQINTFYAGTPLDGNVVSNNGIQSWTVQNSGLYRIQAFGAQGGGTTVRPGGKGAHITGEVFLSAGQTVNVIVGQTGLITTSTTPSGNRGGGGGTFVWDPANTTQPIIVAGGGGGSNASVTGAGLGQDGSAGTDGTLLADGNGSPGTNGNGAAPGGAGFLSDATGGLATNGTQPLGALNGGTGGEGYTATSHYGGFGGAGGGGGSPSTTYASGGGGGYSGGAGQNGSPSQSEGGGGGGSFNAGSNPVNIAGVRTGQGLVIFESLTSGVANDIGISGVTPNTVVCSGDFDISLNAVNFGTTQINSYNVNWTWNGVLQTPIPITSLLDTFGGTGASSTQISLGTQNIVGPNTLEAWTSNPNGQADGLTSNDTLSIVFNPSFVSAGISNIVNGEVCNGGIVNLSASFTGDNLIWYDDSLLTNQIATGSTYTTPNLSNSVTYYLRAENANGCNSAIEPIIAEVNATPTVNFAFSAPVPNGVVSFTGIVSSNTDSVEWTFGTLGTSTTINPQFTFPATGSYLTTLTAFDGTCDNDTIRIVFVTVTSLDGYDWNKQISLYPNPGNGMINLTINDVNEDVNIVVTDLAGQKVHEQVLNYKGQNELKEQMNLRHLKGTFILKLNSGDKQGQFKILIK